MTKATPYRFKLLRDPKALVFGFAVFNFSWICWRAPEWNDDRLAFVAGLLLAASALALVRRVWSNFVAAALGGHLPVLVANEFWILPRRADVPFFSLRHLEYFVSGFVEADAPVLPFLALSVFILACSAHTLRRLAAA